MSVMVFQKIQLRIPVLVVGGWGELYPVLFRFFVKKINSAKTLSVSFYLIIYIN